MKLSRFTSTIRLALVTLAVQFAVIATPTHAQGLPPNDNPATMFKYLCSSLNINLLDLGPSLDALRSLLDALTNIGIDFGNLRLSIDPPTKCLPNVNLTLPRPDQLLACLGQGLPSINFATGDLNGFLGCLTNLLPNYQVRFPTLDPAQLLSCLGNYTAVFDFAQVIQKLARIVKAVVGLIAALTKLIPQINIVFSPQMLTSLKWMVQFCTRTNGRVRGNIFKKSAARSRR